MSINATLFGQMLTFIIFAWFTMKFVWPSLEHALNERKNKIAEGLQAGERGHKELELSQQRATRELKAAREKAAEIINEAHKRAASMLEDAKNEAIIERDHILSTGHTQIELERNKTREELKAEVIDLAVRGAEKILMRTIKDTDHNLFLNQLVGND